MKKIDIKPFGIGQQIWFNIGRLKRVEEILKQPISDILQNTDKLSIQTLLVLLSVGMSQNGNKSEQYYVDKIDEALDRGYALTDIQLPVVKALAGSGILGEAFYYSIFPEELTEEKKKEIESEKN